MIRRELNEMNNWEPEEGWEPPEVVPAELDPDKTYVDKKTQQPLDMETVRAILKAGGYLTDSFDQEGVVFVGNDG